MNKIIRKLTEEREGYIMRNEETGIEIRCTEKFVDSWIKRGFIIKRKEMVRLMDK